MRTTVRLEDSLLIEVKKLAAESGTTLTAIIEDALRERLNRRQQLKPQREVRFTTFKGNGLCPGVDLDDTASLLDIMEDFDASH